MPIDLYSMKMSPPCRAVLMTARELNIELNVIDVDLTQSEHLKPEFVKLNPAHTLPTISDDGFVLWESRAVMQYLCNRYAPDSTLYPTDPKARAQVDRWLYYDMSVFAAQRHALLMKLITGAEPPEDKVKAYTDSLKVVDQLIGDNKYLVGEQLTIADLSFLATISVLLLVEYDLTDYPNLKRWLTSIRTELPYFDDINTFDKEEVASYIEKTRARLAAAASAE